MDYNDLLPEETPAMYKDAGKIIETKPSVSVKLFP